MKQTNRSIFRMQTLSNFFFFIQNSQMHMAATRARIRITQLSIVGTSQSDKRKMSKQVLFLGAYR